MYTGHYERLEIFARPADGRRGRIQLLDEDGSVLHQRELEHIYGNWIRLPLKKESSYQVRLTDAEAVLAYLSGCEDILEQGICILDIENDFREMDAQQFYRFCDTPYREQYHFTPAANWMNDPNGLCWFKGYYHLFYQYNPFGQEWNNMYWGHAASRDLIHWKHLPVVLEPQEEILDNPEIKGGAFSGSAVPQGDEVFFYLTRHVGPLKDGWDTIQYQTMMKSRDMLSFTPEKEIIRERPEHASFDFRDPKAGKYNDQWYLVLGSCLKEKGAILLYESPDNEHWNYLCPLLTEKEAIRTIECPDFFPLDGKYVAMGALMDHYDVQGRFQMSRYYIGDWQGRELSVEKEQWVDFGSNCYAAQTFCHEGRRILIGWISDFYHEHVKTEPGAYGSMTLPRQLHLRDGHVYAQPIQEVYGLRDELLYSGQCHELYRENIEGNQYYARLSFDRPCDFQAVLGRDGEKEISLISRQGKTYLKTKGVKSKDIDFVSQVEECRNAEIFVDRRTVEVYLNDGEAAGTKLFYNSSREGSFRLNAGESVQVELYTMKSIWQYKRKGE